MRDKKIITSLVRGLRILELFGESSRPLTLTEVARMSQLSKTTVQRFLNTLSSIGYLDRDEWKTYSLNIKVLSLGFNFLNNHNLTNMIKPYVRELSLDLGKTANLVVLDDVDVVYLYRREVKKFLTFDIHPGSRLPAHCTAGGKVLLSGLDDADLRKRMAKMELSQVTVMTITSKERLWQEIMESRRRGYAICDREISMDLYSIAVPLVSDDGKMLAAINISIDAHASDAAMKNRVLTKVLETGKEISNLLGYKGMYPPGVTPNGRHDG